MKRILVIDDEPDIRELLRRMLERKGYRVTEAPDGAVGVKLYREDPVDLIITDIIMPEKEGLETIMELRRDFPDVRIIAISGGGKAMQSFSCLSLAEKLGARRSISKPINQAALLETVAAVLEE